MYLFLLFSSEFMFHKAYISSHFQHARWLTLFGLPSIQLFTHEEFSLLIARRKQPESVYFLNRPR